MSLTEHLSEVPDPGWTCRTKCRPFELNANSNILGEAVRGRECYWLGKPCHAGTTKTRTSITQEHVNHCNFDPHLEICDEKSSAAHFGPYYRSVPGSSIRARPAFICFGHLWRVFLFLAFLDTSHGPRTRVFLLLLAMFQRKFKFE